LLNENLKKFWYYKRSLKPNCISNNTHCQGEEKKQASVIIDASIAVPPKQRSRSPSILKDQTLTLIHKIVEKPGH